MSIGGRGGQASAQIVREGDGAMGRGILSLTAVFGLLCPLPAWAEGDRERGRTLAIENCSQCHVIGDYNPYGGVNNSPSFYIFSERPEVYRERLRTFDQRRPHLSRDMDVSAEEIRDIMAYVETLERP
jgi:mono/diheme cytochrome c family protein